MAPTPVTVTQSYSLANGNVPTGQLVIRPSTAFKNGQTIVAAPIRVNLNSSGAISVMLFANTDPETEPDGTYYHVREEIYGHRAGINTFDSTNSPAVNEYWIQVPYNTGPTRNLGDLIVEQISSPGSTPVPGPVGPTGPAGPPGPPGSGSGSTTSLYLRGVNAAGGEFAPSSATLPGVYGTDYAYDSSAAFATLGARGHKLIRLPFRWERIQPVRNAALNSSELFRLKQVVSDIEDAGMQAILDVHNYGRYINSAANGGAELVLGSTLPTADLLDLWDRLSAEFKDNSGVYAYGLMNEPHDIAATLGTFGGTTRYDWNAGTVAGWTGDSATASNVSNRLRLSATLGSGSVNTRKDDAGAVSGGSTPTGNVIRFEATLVSGSPAGTWTVKAQWQNSGFSWVNPTSVSYYRVDNGAAVSGLVTGVPVYVYCTFSSITSPPNAFAIQIDGTGASAGTVTVDIDNFAQGNMSGGLTSAEVWEEISQDLVDTIRANGDSTRIMVPGYAWSSIKEWLNNHPDPWIIDPDSNFAYEGHFYLDGNNSGVYASSYATENSAAVTNGYTNLAARVADEVDPWLDWLADNDVNGFVGEMGWPDNADAASWNAVGEVLYDLFDAARVDVTYWAAGARWGTGYALSAYTGSTQSTAKAQAAVIEAHRTSSVDSAAQLASLDARISSLEQGGSEQEQAIPHSGPAYMVIDAVTPSELATSKAAGSTHALVQVFWDQCQSTAGGAVTASGVITQINDAIDAGLKVCLRVSLQYPPTFVQTGVPKFKRNGGTEHSPLQSSGDNVRDWVWSKTGRDYVEDFLDKLFVQLDWSKVERVQLGGLVAGELCYPNSDTVTPAPYWWGFSAPAQTGTDLALRQSVCPLPAHVPSTGTTWTDDDETWLTWYLQSLVNWMIWLIERHRKYFSGPIWVMHPSSGLRRNSQTPTNGQALNFRMNAAKGTDWYSQISAYPDNDIHPYSTWIDGQHFWAPAPYSDVNDGNAAAWYHLLRVAKLYGRAGRIWGENTGNNTNTDMNRVFQTGAVTFGYQGVVWLSHDTLASGTDDTYANWTARIG